MLDDTANSPSATDSTTPPIEARPLRCAVTNATVAALLPLMRSVGVPDRPAARTECDHGDPERRNFWIFLPSERSTLDLPEHLFDTGRVEYVEPPPPWEVGRQDILNALEAQMPRHTFGQPVPVVARIEWADDGEEQLETEALGWTDRQVYVRLPDSRWRFTSVWLRASDVRRR